MFRLGWRRQLGLAVHHRDDVRQRELEIVRIEYGDGLSFRLRFDGRFRRDVGHVRNGRGERQRVRIGVELRIR